MDIPAKYLAQTWELYREVAKQKGWTEYRDYGRNIPADCPAPWEGSQHSKRARLGPLRSQQSAKIRMNPTHKTLSA